MIEKKISQRCSIEAEDITHSITHSVKVLLDDATTDDGIELWFKPSEAYELAQALMAIPSVSAYCDA